MVKKKKDHNFVPSSMSFDINGYRLIFGSRYCNRNCGLDLIIMIFSENDKRIEIFNFVEVRCLMCNINGHFDITIAI